MKNGFIFYASWWDAIKNLPRDVQGDVLTAIVEYGISGETTEQLKPIAKALLTLVKPQIDANNQRYENGKKGGRPKDGINLTDIDVKPNGNQTETKAEPNGNQTETYKDKVKSIKSKKKPSTDVEGKKEAANAAPPAPGQGDSLPDAGPCHEAGWCYAPAAGSPDKGVATARAGNGTKGADGDDATTQTPHRSRAKDMAGRMADFQREVCAYGDKYPQELLEAFFNYWSETNRAGTKMRFELERTWDTARRLATWARKEQDYAKNRRSNGNRDAKQEANEYAVRGLMERIAARRSGTLDEGERPF